jgi:hypothetical protein
MGSQKSDMRWTSLMCRDAKTEGVVLRRGDGESELGQALMGNVSLGKGVARPAPPPARERRSPQ